MLRRGGEPMSARARTLLQAKDFAMRAGVTVRTLHVYDRLGLLRPADRTGSGYRLYGEAELERLEQILALRFVGFSLERIKELLEGPPWPLIAALRMQREIVAQQKRRLESAIAAIDEAERILNADGSADRWKTLRNVIEVLKMENDWSWTEKYYSDEQRAKLAELHKETSKETIEQGQRDWTVLIADVERAAAEGVKPESDSAQSLARRWSDLVAQFTKRDPEIKSALNRMWTDQTNWPKDFKRPWSDAADEFIKKAMNCRAR
jgi:DNA-binding transcriptional MerR regulator